VLNFKYTKSELYKFLGLCLFAWYACIRWTNQGNTLGTFVTDEHGIKSFVLSWIFAPINLATAFITTWFIAKVIVEFNKSFNPYMGLIAFFLFCRNVYYALEDYRDYLINPTTEQLFFIGLDLAMVLYVIVWAIIYWSQNNDK
jgi:hypothetical protein